MGTKLAKIFDIVTEKKGYTGRMKFAQKIGISKNKARKITDKDDLVNRFQTVAANFIGEDLDDLFK